MTAASGSQGSQPGLPDPVSALLLDWVRVLYRRRWQALSVFLIVVVGATWYTFTREPIYQAEATILIEAQDPNIVSFEEVRDEGQSRGAYYETQHEILRSRALAGKTVDVLDLSARPEFLRANDNSISLTGLVTNAIRTTSAALFRWGSEASAQSQAPASEDDDENLSDTRQSPQRRAAVGRLRSGLQISPVRGTRLVDVRFRSPDPSLAAEIANAHSEQYIEQNLELRFAASVEAGDWLEERLGEERARVEETELALQTFREERDGVSLEERQNVVVQQLSALNAALTRARANRIEVGSRLEQVVAASEGSDSLEALPALLSNSFVQQLQASLADLERHRATLAETLGERHPRMVENRAAIVETRNRLDVEIVNLVESIRSEHRAAQAEEASLAAALEQQKSEALELDRRGIEYRVLTREADSLRGVYESLLQRANETDVSTALRTSHVRIVDQAEPPRTPAYPRKRFNLLMAVLSGALLGVGTALSFELLSDRLKTPDDIRAHLGIPFLGLVPQVTPTRRIPLLSGPESPSPVSGELSAGFVEALRTVRTNVLLSLGEGSPRSLAISSANEGEGKTVVASNLAVALARARQRVLLIDGDMRRSRVHEVFGLPLVPGLSEILTGETRHSGENGSRLLHDTEVRGLKVLTAGAPPPDAPELLGSRQFDELIKSLNDFDWVIVDTPPANVVADAEVVAQRVDAVVLVVRADITGRRDAIVALEQLQTGRGRAMGAVLNGVQLARHGYYYSPYHRREYSSYLQSTNSSPSEPVGVDLTMRERPSASNTVESSASRPLGLGRGTAESDQNLESHADQ